MMGKAFEARLAKLEGRTRPAGPTMSQAERDEAVRLALLGPMPDLDSLVDRNSRLTAAQQRAAIEAAWKADT